MSWMIVGATIVAFLLGGLIVAEYLCRRDAARHHMPWVENMPDASHKLSSD